jgi:hypothetical protein
MTSAKLLIDAISALGNYPALKREEFPTDHLHSQEGSSQQGGKWSCLRHTGSRVASP